MHDRFRERGGEQHHRDNPGEEGVLHSEDERAVGHPTAGEAADPAVEPAERHRAVLAVRPFGCVFERDPGGEDPGFRS